MADETDDATELADDMAHPDKFVEALDALKRLVAACPTDIASGQITPAQLAEYVAAIANAKQAIFDAGG